MFKKHMEGWVLLSRHMRNELFPLLRVPRWVWLRACLRERETLNKSCKTFSSFIADAFVECVLSFLGSLRACRAV